MTTTESTAYYALRRTPEEYERLRLQARVWEEATGRLLDRVGLAAGARCLDAGCGPGETMRLMALRVGPAGRVTGIDADAPLAARTERMLHDGGHRQCRVIAHDLTAYESVPGGPARTTWSSLVCCCSTCPSGSPCCAGCGSRSPRAVTCWCRTTTWTRSGCCRRRPRSTRPAG
ncbi:SAM-dependent methyltransferase [Actinoplanes subtropicus]|uniref:SAM-dependent methyltransferase n=1 Tax=Actinoplanes subtropicus TaxID=543632 RepID=UPI0004C32EAE|nr:methyltransferase domain-containing protein [Actinoplanes subtropicus]